MKVWIVTIYEPLPFGDIRTRPQRCGMLAKALIDRGHMVELWTSAFDHVSHKHIHNESFFENIGDHISIQFIKGCGYLNDHSLTRFYHNRQTAREFLRLANDRDEFPDIIFAPVPIPELAESAVAYAIQRGIPVVVDIRDLWPDVYLTMLPRVLHPLGRMLLYFEYRRAELIFKQASSITAVSETYLKKGLAYARRTQRNTDRFFPLGSEVPMSLKTAGSEGITESVVRKYGIDKEHFIVTYVGTFSRFIDIQNILDAAERLLDMKDVRIFIVGAGERSDEFNVSAKRLPNVTMTGWLNAQEVRAILAETDVGLAAYAKGAIMSLPNKPFEYMAAGLPLLSSLRGELELLIQEYAIGRNYEAGNPEALAKEIRWFSDNPEEVNQMGKRAQALFSSKFRSDIVYEDFSKYLENMEGFRVITYE